MYGLHVQIKLLYDEIFTTRGYHRDQAPINVLVPGNSTEATKLLVLIILQTIYLTDLDVSKHMLSTYFELEMRWMDPRLAWSTEQFGAVDKTYIQCDSLWIPGISLISALRLTEVFPEQFRECTLYANGTVKYDLMFTADIGCQFEVENFPFDSQNCSLQFGTSTYSWDEIELEGLMFQKYSAMNNSVYSNGEWLIENVTQQVATFDIIGGVQDVLIFQLTCKRQPSFYIYVIAIPCFILTFLSISGSFWTPNLEEEQLSKLSLTLTSMMSMTTFVNIVSQQVPKTSTFPLLGIFVLCCVFIVSVAALIIVTCREKKKIMPKFDKSHKR
ncbi:unnamed protein product, partial [Mesorhabditis spiculigera]